MNSCKAAVLFAPLNCLLPLSPYFLSTPYFCPTAAAGDCALPGGDAPEPSPEGALRLGPTVPGSLRRRPLRTASFRALRRPLAASTSHSHCRAAWHVLPCAFKGCLRNESHFLRLMLSFPNFGPASSSQPQPPKETNSKTGSVSPCFIRYMHISLTLSVVVILNGYSSLLRKSNIFSPIPISYVG